MTIEERRAYYKAYRESHKDSILSSQRRYDKTHKEQKKFYRQSHESDIKEYRFRNRDKLLLQYKEYDLTHKIHKIKYRQQHRKERSEYVSSYNKHRRSIDSGFKILNLLRSRILISIKKGFKSSDTISLIGCSLEKLKEHLSSTAVNNGYNDFNIDKYSSKEYHIDHIVPCSAFNLACSYHQRLCFNWKNLQILRASVNLSKGDTLDDKSF